MVLRNSIIPLLFFIFCINFSLNGQCLDGDCKNGKGVYQFPSGSVYTGQFKEGQFHGWGECEYADGDKYVGWWEARLPEGTGTLFGSDGSVTKGLWKQGVLVNEDGEVINDDFAIKSIAEGEVQTGCLSGNCEDGNGIMGFPDGTRYEGGFVKGKFHGLGKWFYTNGDVFDGNWHENFPHGDGRIIHEDQSETKGVWEFGVYLGETRGGSIRDCTYGDCGNIKEGYYQYSDGTRYKGEFKNGLPQGWGRVEYPGGEIYEGDWLSDIAHGYGTFTTSDGKEFVGLWENGEYIPYKEVSDPTLMVEDNGDTKVWAVIVGVSSYTHMKPLKYSDNDAFRLMAFMQSPAGGALPDEQIRVLIDEDATHENIIQSMKEIYGKADKDDLIMLYFSGHGLKGSFLPIDYDGYHNRLLHTEIQGIFEKSMAKYKLCIADACHSGSYSFASKGYNIDEIVSDYYNTLSNSKGGTALMLSSKPEETSLESLRVRQGVFSHYLLRGMKGEADYNGNGIVSLKELYDYIDTEVKSYTQFRQSPVIKGDYDEEMPVSVIRK